jgi:transposase-like protein
MMSIQPRFTTMRRMQTYLHELGLMPDKDFLRQTLRGLAEAIMALEVSREIDADHYERADGRQTYRNGYRQRTWRTRVGDIDVAVPRLRQGSYAPAFLRLRADEVLLGAIQDSYANGVRMETIAHVFEALRLNALTAADEASLCEWLDEQIEAYRDRPLDDAWAYLWLDALPLPDAGQPGRSHRVLAVVFGLDPSGDHIALDFEPGFSADDPQVWRRLFRRLQARGLTGVELVISDGFGGIKALVHDLLDAGWRFSRAHAIDDVLSTIPVAEREAVVAAISTAFIQPTPQAARERISGTVEMLGSRWPRAASSLMLLADELLVSAIRSDDWLWQAGLDVMMRIKQAMAAESDAVAVSPDASGGSLVLTDDRVGELADLTRRGMETLHILDTGIMQPAIADA